MASSKPIYLDYMATTPIDPRVLNEMLHYMGVDACFANPSSTHTLGREAALAVERARSQVAALLNAQDSEIIFTSGATEANNLAILGVARFYGHKGKHIITLCTEHKAVLDPCAQLEKEGYEVTYLVPGPEGLLDSQTLKDALRPDTLLVSVMHVNNEIGVIQDIAAIADIVKANGSIFHVDAAQSAGKVAIDVSAIPIDLLSLSAHKFYGPKGVGALFCRGNPRVRLSPLMYGGGQERGLRSGTLPTHQLVGMGMAADIAQQALQDEALIYQRYKQQFLDGLLPLGGIHINGSLNQALPACLNISVEGVEGDSLRLSLHELCFASSSACMASQHQPSYVLRALGRSPALAFSALRLSVGRFTKDDDVTMAIHIIQKQIHRLRALRPS